MKVRHANKVRNRAIKEFKKMMKKQSECVRSNFYSHDYIPEEGFNSYCDCYFIGKFQGKRVMFNATILSLKLHFADLLWDKVYEEANSTHPDYKELTKITFKSDIDSGIPTGSNFLDFDGPGWKRAKEIDDQITKRILANNELTACPMIEVLPDYQFGIGITIVLDDVLNETSIAKGIEMVNKTFRLSEYKKYFYGDYKSFTAKELEDNSSLVSLIVD